ncbi:MAG: hypothetical protein H6999_09975 [Hahellaceae bacterium]|nr:hypothetical protein [Hahellaceae bacterium]MCP5170072.1 hypothetical protein [Hahellaceae bacterium]
MKHLKLLIIPFVLGGVGIAVWWHHSQRSNTSDEELSPAYTWETSAVGQPIAALDIPANVGSEVLSAEAEVEKTPWVGAAVPSVLEGTEIDGVLEVDESGNLKVTLGVRDFFDYFLSAVGELSPEEAIQEIQNQLSRRLPPAAALQAMQLLNDYLEYQKHMASLMARQLIPSDQQNYGYYAQVMEETFSEVRALRRQYLSPAAVEAFFSLEETYSEYAVQTIKIQADQQSSEHEKEIQLAALNAQMPAYMKAQADASRERAELATNAQSMFNQGWSSESVRSLLQNHFSNEEVDQMLSFYEHENAWQQRLQQYLTRKQTLDAQTLDDATLQAQLNLIRAEIFQDDELPRVLADEAIAEKLARLNSTAKEGASSGS